MPQDPEFSRPPLPPGLNSQGDGDTNPGRVDQPTVDELRDEQIASALDPIEGDARLSDTVTHDVDSEFETLRPVVDKLKSLSDVVEFGSDQPPAAAASRSASAEKIPTAIGKYTIKEVLGRGGQAAAYLAFDPDLQRHVVLKVYHLAITDVMRDMVLREGRILARVQSPFVAQCYGAERHEGVPYLVMEYIRGRTLAETYAQHRPSTSVALDLVRQVGEGLVAVHASGLIHRDIKPANIIVGDDGVPRLVDFGLASFLASEDLSSVSGTPRYMAPEQARGEWERVDHRADIFGLGAVLYELLTGQGPFQAATMEGSLRMAREGDVLPPQRRVASVPDNVDELCQRCLAKSPSNRPDSAKELIAAISSLQEHKVNSGGSSVLKWSAIGALALVVMLGAFFMRPWRKGPEKKANTVGNKDNEQAAVTKGPKHPDGRALRQDFPMDVEIMGAEVVDGLHTLTEGTTIRIRLTAQQDCYVGVWSVEQATVVQLFPNESEKDSSLKSSVARVVPGEATTEGTDDQQFRVTASTGPEFIHVLAATRPLPKTRGSLYGPYVLLESEADRNRWTQRLRGIVLEKKVSQAPGMHPESKMAVSELIIPYTVRRKAKDEKAQKDEKSKDE